MAYYIVLTLFIFFVIASCAQTSSPTCFLVNLGDSNSDTGAVCPVYGAANDPSPVRLFPGHEKSCRLGNGRVYLDFLCEFMGINYLSPYLMSLESDFSHGVNFAFSGAKASVNSTFPFHVNVQAHQFGYFRNHTKGLLQAGEGKHLRKAIFSVDIGQNDLSELWSTNHTARTAKIPEFVTSIESAIKVLYGLGARKFVIYNTGPLGCLPFFKWVGDRDEIGCSADLNGFARSFNEALGALYSKLKDEMKDAILVYVDMFAIKYDLFANPSKYGFVDRFQACNYFNGTFCADPTHAISWDGVHFTDSANKFVADAIWSGNFSLPKFNIKDLCELN